MNFFMFVCYVINFIKLKLMYCFPFVLVKEQLAHDPDNEVATTSLKVSLCCPVNELLTGYSF